MQSEMPRAKTTPRKDGAARKKSVSRTTRAGLTMPVGRVHTAMKREGGLERVSGGAPIYLAAVAEYFAAEIIEVAGNLTLEAKRKRITPEDLASAVRGDRELNVACGAVLAAGGAIKGVAKAISPPKKAAEQVTETPRAEKGAKKKAK